MTSQNVGGFDRERAEAAVRDRAHAEHARAENARLRKMYVEEKLKAEIVAEALAKKW